MLASTLLISAAPKPVAVRLCLGREMPSGPTGPWRSEMGADVESLLSWVLVAMIAGERRNWWEESGIIVRNNERKWSGESVEVLSRPIAFSSQTRNYY